MKRKWRCWGVLLAVALGLLLAGCSSDTSDVPKGQPVTAAPVSATDLAGWHRVDDLGLSYYASDEWAEEKQLWDETVKTLEYPLSNGQYYSITVTEYAADPVDLQKAVENQLEALQLMEYESEKQVKDDQIRQADWTNGAYSGTLISYRTRYSKEFYHGYLEGFKDIIVDDTSYGKILVIVDGDKMYQFSITAYQDVEEAFDQFDRMIATIGME